LREARGLSQSALARALGTQAPAISRIEDADYDGHSLAMLRRIVTVIEGDAVYRSRNPKGEPQLGRRGLYATMGGQRSAGFDQMALLWVLNLADGCHSLLDMADRAGLPFATIRAAADALLAADLLAPISVQR